MIRVDFDRSAGSASALGFVCRTEHGAEPIYKLVRVLADRGFSGPAEFFDERGMKCLTVRCVAAMARRYAPDGNERARKREAKRAA